MSVKSSIEHMNQLCPQFHTGYVGRGANGQDMIIGMYESLAIKISMPSFSFFFNRYIARNILKNVDCLTESSIMCYVYHTKQLNVFTNQIRAQRKICIKY